MLAFGFRIAAVHSAGADDKRPEVLFVARPLTQPGEFTIGIEGPNCDARGNIYAVNFRTEGTIGIVTPEGHGDVYVTLPAGSVGNGIVFDRKGTMYVADYTGHNVLVIDPATRKSPRLRPRAADGSTERSGDRAGRDDFRQRPELEEQGPAASGASTPMARSR